MKSIAAIIGVIFCLMAIVYFTLPPAGNQPTAEQLKREAEEYHSYMVSPPCGKAHLATMFKLEPYQDGTRMAIYCAKEEPK
jgi:hypothetical protein